MISLSKILVGVDLSHGDRLISNDLSDQCEQAVKKAILLAQGAGGTLTFITSINISEQAMHLIKLEGGQEKPTILVEAEKVLAGLVERAEQAGVKADCKAIFGSSWHEITKEALEEDYTLVVIGRKKKSRVEDFIFGRTTVKLLRRCPLPVYVAKPDPVRQVESILVADDFTELGEELLDAGVQLARLFDIRLHVVHVVEAGDDYKLAGSGITEDDLNKLHEKELEQAKTTLAERLSRTDYRTLTYGAVTHVEKGIAETVISRILEENDIDLLVMGTVGRSGLSAMIMGNTAERLLNHTDCSVLVMKPEFGDGC